MLMGTILTLKYLRLTLRLDGVIIESFYILPITLLESNIIDGEGL